jgi:hypothetical protein
MYSKATEFNKGGRENSIEQININKQVVTTNELGNTSKSKPIIKLVRITRVVIFFTDIFVVLSAKAATTGCITTEPIEERESMIPIWPVLYCFHFKKMAAKPRMEQKDIQKNP